MPHKFLCSVQPSIGKDYSSSLMAQRMKAKGFHASTFTQLWHELSAGSEGLP